VLTVIVPIEQKYNKSLDRIIWDCVKARVFWYTDLFIFTTTYATFKL